MTSTLPPLVQAFSGSIGSVTANAIVYPLDLVATRLQTTSSRKLRGFRGIIHALRHVISADGWSGLYDGLGTDSAANLLSNFLYFYFYTLLRALIIKRRGPRTHSLTRGGKVAPLVLSISEELCIGFLAGVASRAISTPLSVVTVRLQTETEGEDEEGEMNAEEGNIEDAKRRGKAKGVWRTVQTIYEDQGLSGFWGGFTTTIPLSLNPAITLFLFQLFRRVSSLQSAKPQSKLNTPSAGSAFMGAAVSNAISTALLYPLMLAKTRLQVHRKQAKEDGVSTKHDGVNMFSIWREALRKEGARGLYQGLEAQVTKGFVSQGVTMMVKQRIELYVVALYLRSLRRSSL